MNRATRLFVVGLVIGTVPLLGCQKQSGKSQEHEPPARVERIEGSELSRVTLTPNAMQRLDVQTAKVSEQKGPRQESPQMTVPYAAVLYDPHGKTFVYKSPESRVFVRHAIDVDYIEVSAKSRHVQTLRSHSPG